MIQLSAYTNSKWTRGLELSTKIELFWFFLRGMAELSTLEYRNAIWKRWVLLKTNNVNTCTFDLSDSASVDFVAQETPIISGLWISVEAKLLFTIDKQYPMLLPGCGWPPLIRAIPWIRPSDAMQRRDVCRQESTQNAILLALLSVWSRMSEDVERNTRRNPMLQIYQATSKVWIPWDVYLFCNACSLSAQSRTPVALVSNLTDLPSDRVSSLQISPAIRIKLQNRQASFWMDR